MAIFDVLKVSTETTLYKSNTILSSILLIEKCTFKSFLLTYFIFIQSIITSWINRHCLQCTADLFNLSHNRVSCNSPTYNLFSICSSLAVAGGQDVRGATPSAAPRPGGRLNFAALPIRDDALPEGLEGLSAVGSAE